ncbi:MULTISPECIES: ABC transporter ATP-binding protein [unclassified Mycolicibacterium]|uniref:ABC transporter ATP-binding protein n=1 Tax=unclassified Mycolicibacterium TaxID=2636767 RepID=UPI002EDA7C1D
MGTETVRVTAGHKKFGATTVLRDIDLSIEDGEFLAVLGTSGSGKSTLLRAIAGLEQLTTGTVEWGDGNRPRTGVVFQQAMLMPWLTVRANVCFAKRFSAHRDGFDQTYAEQLMDRFGLGGLADRYPDQLSGGQAQRVAILRAAATRPRLLLLDEPFSALDPATRTDLRGWLADLVTQLSVTVVLVTHDIDEALELADRIVLLGEDGRIGSQWVVDRDSAASAQLRSDILGHYRLVGSASS